MHLPPLVCALAFSLTMPQPREAVNERTLVLRNVTIIDGTGTPPLPNRTIVIKAGRILEVAGSPDRAPAPGPDAEHLDLTGHYAIPGLVDTHVHLKAQPSGSLAFAHIQAAHPVHRALLREGYDRSVTFRQLVGEIEASDWLVFLQAGRCPERATVACLLHFVGTFAGRSYVRVVVRHEHRHADNVISSLAHELQHAREVIEAPGVHDAAGIRDLFTRIGRVSVKSAGVRTYETDRARQIGEAVWRELLKKRRCSSVSQILRVFRSGSHSALR